MAHERLAQRFAIVSGKGGVGKSIIAANLAAALVSAGQRVLILDADLGLANLDVILGLNPKHTLLDVVHGHTNIDEALISTPAGFDLLPAGSGIQEGTVLTEALFQGLDPILSAVETRYDVIFFDAGAGIGDVVLFFTELADEVLLIVTPEPTSLMDGYATIKVLAKRFGRKEILLVVNQADSRNPEQTGAAVTNNLQGVASRFLMADGLGSVRICLAGVIPSDPALGQSVSRQQILIKSNPNAPSARAIKLLADALVARMSAQS